MPSPKDITRQLGRLPAERMYASKQIRILVSQPAQAAVRRLAFDPFSTFTWILVFGLVLIQFAFLYWLHAFA